MANRTKISSHIVELTRHFKCAHWTC